MANLLQEYQYLDHVPNDIGVNDLFLPPQTFNMQEKLNNISEWKKENLMKLNQKKSNYIFFTRTVNKDFQKRLTMDGQKIDRQHVVKVLGVWLSEDISDWSKNTSEICRKAYGRIRMLAKLKYVGFCTEDLLEIYCLFIRSTAEYCSAVLPHY